MNTIALIAKTILKSFANIVIDIGKSIVRHIVNIVLPIVESTFRKSGHAAVPMRVSIRRSTEKRPIYVGHGKETLKSRRLMTVLFSSKRVIGVQCATERPSLTTITNIGFIRRSTISYL